MTASPLSTFEGHGFIKDRIALSALALVLSWAPVAAQTRCAPQTAGDPPRAVVVCPGGITVIPEVGTRYEFIDRNRDGRPEGARLYEKGLFLDLPAGRARGGFQILTPHAIASVRGTRWAVDVTSSRTSVFVAEGAVAVALPSRRARAVLQPGDGVDVEAGATEIVVKRWSPERAASLLARFGR
jgi:hypothetical protein